MENVEELAKRLLEAGKFPGTFNGTPVWAKNIAKEVQCLIIEARIEELNNIEFKGEWDISTANKINENIDYRIMLLEKQLTELRGKNDKG